MSAIINDDWWGGLSANPEVGWTPSDAYSSEFDASNANPAADSWSDILKYGFGRAVDYGIASLQLQNTRAATQQQPYQQPQRIVAAGGESSLLMLLVVGAIVFLIAK
ncbi:MAG TPA: hypothetical protein VGE10_01725 [Zeimonas sp.]